MILLVSGRHVGAHPDGHQRGWLRCFTVWMKFIICLLKRLYLQRQVSFSLFVVTVSVFFPKRKKDQYREGQTSLLAMSQKSVCQVSITKRLLFPLSRESSSPLVRRIVKSKSKEYFHATKGVSYATLEEEFRIKIC